MSSIIATTAIRGRFLDIKNTVAQAREIHDQVRYVEDGLLISQNGEIQWFGSWEEGQQHLPEGVQVAHYPEQLIVPGFIDTHIHFPQTEMVGAYGEQLLEWLNTYTFPTEIQFQDPAYSQKIAQFLFRNC